MMVVDVVVMGGASKDATHIFVILCPFTSCGWSFKEKGGGSTAGKAPWHCEQIFMAPADAYAGPLFP